MRINFNNGLQELISKIPFKNEKEFRNIELQKLVSTWLLSNTDFEKFYSDTINILSKNRFLVIDNFPLDDNFLLGFASCFGFVSEPYKSPKSLLVQSISYNPSTDSVVSVFHSDDSGWEHSSKYGFLLIVESDKNKNGKTRILRNDDLILHLVNSSKNKLLKELQEVVFPFKKADSDEGYFLKHIIEKDERGNYQIRYLAETISDGIALKPISKEQEQILSDFHNTLLNVLPSFDELLSSGSLLIFDNHFSMHLKTKLDADSNRVIKRVKVFNSN